MTLGDLLWIALLVAFAAFALDAARRLRTMPDWQERLGYSHAPIYVRLGELVYWLVRHIHGTASRPGRRLEHVRRALLALFFLAATALTPVLTLALGSKPDFSRHGLAIGIGALVWTILVESVAVSDRLRRISERVALLPVLVHILITFLLDAAISCLALSGAIAGEPLASACIGAAFVAAADVVSTLVGVAAAAFPEYPLLDPPDGVPGHIVGPSRPRTPPGGTLQP